MRLDPRFAGVPSAWRTSTETAQCDAFLFDLDDVLVDSRAVVERTCRRWAPRRQLDPEKVLRIALGRRTRDTVQAAASHPETDRGRGSTPRPGDRAHYDAWDRSATRSSLRRDELSVADPIRDLGVAEPSANCEFPHL